jgi:hypothetical protein
LEIWKKLIFQRIEKAAQNKGKVIENNLIFGENPLVAKSHIYRK